MPTITVKENEQLDYSLRRFRRKCDIAGVILEARQRQFYEKPTWVRKRKADAAVKRARYLQRSQNS